MRDQYDSRNKPRRNGRETGTWRLTSIRVVNRTPALGAVAPVFEGVDVGDVGSRGQGSEVHVIVVFAVGAEWGELVGRVGFTAQQEGERHKDSRLYRGSRGEQCSQESAGARGESGGFYGEDGEMSGGCRQGGEREEDGIYDEGDSRVGRE